MYEPEKVVEQPSAEQPSGLTATEDRVREYALGCFDARSVSPTAAREYVELHSGLMRGALKSSEDWIYQQALRFLAMREEHYHSIISVVDPVTASRDSIRGLIGGSLALAPREAPRTRLRVEDWETWRWHEEEPPLLGRDRFMGNRRENLVELEFFPGKPAAAEVVGEPDLLAYIMGYRTKLSRDAGMRECLRVRDLANSLMPLLNMPLHFNDDAFASSSTRPSFMRQSDTVRKTKEKKTREDHAYVREKMKEVIERVNDIEVIRNAVFLGFCSTYRFGIALTNTIKTIDSIFKDPRVKKHVAHLREKKRKQALMWTDTTNGLPTPRNARRTTADLEAVLGLAMWCEQRTYLVW